MSDVSNPIHISSLAAPSADDIARWNKLSDDEKRDVIARHIAGADDDIKNGRSTVMNSADDVRNFFQNRLKKYES